MIKKLYMSIVILTLGLQGCKHTPPVNNPLPPSPSIIESVLPNMRKVDDGINNTLIHNKKLDEKIKEQSEVVNAQKLEIENALAQAQKLKEKILANQIISELEANNLIDQLKKVESRNMFLELKNKELTTIKTDQEKLLQDLKQQSVDTLLKLTQKENETKELRTQNDYLRTTVETKNKDIQTLSDSLEKEKIKSANAGVYKRWVIGIIVGFVLWIIIKNVLMIYMPTTRFRI